MIRGKWSIPSKWMYIKYGWFVNIKIDTTADRTEKTQHELKQSIVRMKKIRKLKCCLVLFIVILLLVVFICAILFVKSAFWLIYCNVYALKHILNNGIYSCNSKIRFVPKLTEIVFLYHQYSWNGVVCIYFKLWILHFSLLTSLLCIL